MAVRLNDVTSCGDAIRAGSLVFGEGWGTISSHAWLEEVQVGQTDRGIKDPPPTVWVQPAPSCQVAGGERRGERSLEIGSLSCKSRRRKSQGLARQTSIETIRPAGAPVTATVLRAGFSRASLGFRVWGLLTTESRCGAVGEGGRRGVGK